MSGLIGLSRNSLSFKEGSNQFSKIHSDSAALITLHGATDGSTCVVAGVAAPTADDHAATKKYVDDSGGGGGVPPDNSITNAKLFTGATVTANKCDTDEILVTTALAQSKSGVLSITNSTQSTSAGDGCLVLSGGIGVAKDIVSAGTVTATAHITTSDRRMKADVQRLSGGGELLARVNTYTYHLKDDPKKAAKVGVIAQELLADEALSGFVSSGTQEGFYAVDYTNFIALLIGAVNDLTEEVQELKRQDRARNK